MANNNIKRSELIRVDPDFKKWLEETARIKSVQEKCDIRPTRLTQAIFNLRNKYPLDAELKLSKLGKWKSK